MGIGPHRIGCPVGTDGDPMGNLPDGHRPHRAPIGQSHERLSTDLFLRANQMGNLSMIPSEPCGGTDGHKSQTSTTASTTTRICSLAADHWPKNGALQLVVSPTRCSFPRFPTRVWHYTSRAGTACKEQDVYMKIHVRADAMRAVRP